MSGVHPYRARRRTISLTPLIDVVFPEADARVQTIVTAFERLAAHGIVGATLGDALDRRTEP